MHASVFGRIKDKRLVVELSVLHGLLGKREEQYGTRNFLKGRVVNKANNCGSSRGLSGLVRLSQCSDEVKHHLISCHQSKEVLSENELILARTGLFYLAQDDKPEQKNVDLGNFGEVQR